MFEERRRNDERVRAGVLDEHFVLGRGEHRIERDLERAEPVHREGRLDERRAVLHQNRDPVARLDPESVESPCQSLDPFGHVGVSPCAIDTATGQRSCLRPMSGRSFECVCQIHQL